MHGDVRGWKKEGGGARGNAEAIERGSEAQRYKGVRKNSALQAGLGDDALAGVRQPGLCSRHGAGWCSGVWWPWALLPGGVRFCLGPSPPLPCPWGAPTAGDGLPALLP